MFLKMEICYFKLYLCANNIIVYNEFCFCIFVINFKIIRYNSNEKT